MWKDSLVKCVERRDVSNRLFSLIQNYATGFEIIRIHHKTQWNVWILIILILSIQRRQQANWRLRINKWRITTAHQLSSFFFQPRLVSMGHFGYARHGAKDAITRAPLSLPSYSTQTPNQKFIGAQGFQVLTVSDPRDHWNDYMIVVVKPEMLARHLKTYWSLVQVPTPDQHSLVLSTAEAELAQNSPCHSHRCHLQALVPARRWPLAILRNLAATAPTSWWGWEVKMCL